MLVRPAYTFIEVLIVMVVIAVATAIAWPDDETAAKEAGRLATLKFETDVAYARGYSFARPDDPALIKLDPANNRYWIGTSSSPDTPINHPMSGDPYVVQFGPGGPRGLETVTIYAGDFGGDEIIKFDGTGSIDQDTQAILQFDSKGTPYEIAVKPTSGECLVRETYSIVLEPYDTTIGGLSEGGEAPVKGIHVTQPAN